MSYFPHLSGSFVLRLSFAVVTTMSASGCLHALGLARPSISPRASLDIYDDSTVRAQDTELTPATRIGSGYSDFSTTNSLGSARPGSQVRGTASRAPVLPSHSISSIPKARLLTPQFGGNAAQRRSAVLQTASRPDMELPQPQQVRSAQPSLGFSAEQIRRLMNRQSQSDMADGNVLGDQNDRWKIIASPGAAASPQADVTNVVAATADSVSAKTISIADVSGQALNNANESPAPSADVKDASIAVQTPPEPSMLERLKGFYEPENAARKIWKRPFQKLGNPWAAVFGDREQDVSEPVTPAVDEAVRTADMASGAVDTVPNPLLDQLIAATEAELAGWPLQLTGSPVEPEKHQLRQLDLRLLYLIADQPGKAIRAVEELPGAEQDFWQELMLALAEYRSQSSTDTEQRMTITTGQLRSAVRQLAPLTSLQIRRFEICSRIHSFGRLDSFPANNFDPGQPLLLYAEIENFAAELTPAGSYRTQFEAELKLYEQGNSKAKETIAIPDISDESTSERSDYYQSFELSLPSHLKSGEYTIRLRLRDRVSGKVAESAVEFQVRQPETAELSDSK